jgi:hypothetical protein
MPLPKEVNSTVAVPVSVHFLYRTVAGETGPWRDDGADAFV